jgi:hypothetical protein
MAKVKQLKYWSEFLLLRQKRVYLVSSMTFLLGKYLMLLRVRHCEEQLVPTYRESNLSVNTDRFRQGKKDDAVTLSHHSKTVIFTTALPAGYSNSGTSNNMGTNAYLWTATENNATNAWNRNLNTGNAQSNRNNNNKTNGFSVRCLQNSHKPACCGNTGAGFLSVSISIAVRFI